MPEFDTGEGSDDESDVVIAGYNEQSVNPVEHKPIYVMSTWRHPRTRDGRIALLILLPSGILESENGVEAVVEG